MVHVGKSGEPAELHVKILPIKSLMNLSSKQNLHRVFSDAWILHVYVDLSCFCPLLGTNQARNCHFRHILATIFVWKSYDNRRLI